MADPPSTPPTQEGQDPADVSGIDLGTPSPISPVSRPPPVKTPTGPALPSVTPPPSSSTSGEALWAGRFRISDEIGRGAMSYILRAKDVKLGRELAMKVSPVSRGQLAPLQLARFIEEAQITAQLEHPNIVPVHDLGLDPEERPYFSMKRIRGRSLETILEKRLEGDEQTLAEFGLRRLLDIFLQVCQAVEYAHALGVIHRDLKPSNIMVGDFGEVLVMDWGIAKLKGRPERIAEPSAGDPASTTSGPEAASASHGPSQFEMSSVRAGKKAWATQFGTVVGTPAYMSPEQAKGQDVDGRTDLYSLGIILYEILCGQVPFDDEDPKRALEQQVFEAPRRPSEVHPGTPLALEALAMQLLEKDPAQRRLTIPQIRAHILDYIEGVGRDYRDSSVVSSALWSAGALALFAFVVWYLTGRSISSVLAVGPPAVLNAVGWFLLVLAFGYPLWAAYAAVRLGRAARDRFRPPNAREVFASGYLAHRTFSASVAPLFQLFFIVELVSWTIGQIMRGSIPSNLIEQISAQMRREWQQALITILVFLFGYLFLLCTEIRFARRIDRFEFLVERRRWESAWPFFLIIVLLLTVATTDLFDWVLGSTHPTFIGFFREQVLMQRLDLFDVLKTLVLQGTFLAGLVAATMLLSFPFSDVLAAMRMAYQPPDEASVKSRGQYFLRSMAVFRAASANWLYGGAVIASLSASSVLSDVAAIRPLEKILYILGPSLIGFAGYWVTRRYVRGFLQQAASVRRMLAERCSHAKGEQRAVDFERLRDVPWRLRSTDLAVPVVCILVYLIWTGSGIQQQALRKLILPVTAQGWLLILPYTLLVVMILVRDQPWFRRLRARALGER
jgi:serine/threonine protein kinase